MDCCLSWPPFSWICELWVPARLGWQGGSKTGYGNGDAVRVRDAGVSRARSPGCYCIAFSTAYVRRRRAVEIKFGSVCCACVLLYRENTMKFWKTLSPGRTDYESAAVGAINPKEGLTNARAQPEQSGSGSHLPTALLDALPRWLLVAVAVAVSGAEEGSADDVVGRAGAPGSRFQAQGSP